MRGLWKILLLACGLCLTGASAAGAQQVEVLWLGHSTFRLTSTTGKVIVIDPFLTQNPRAPTKYKDLKALGKVDLILVTHGHQDHVLDLRELGTASARTGSGMFLTVCSPRSSKVACTRPRSATFTASETVMPPDLARPWSRAAMFTPSREPRRWPPRPPPSVASKQRRPRRGWP
jgi:glyoxylase-like metal-dependent hydrolase (beta-lactamase superfamily II)